MKPIFVAAIVLAAAGCTRATPIQDNQGQEAHLIECGTNPLGYCFEKAAEVCPNGYKTVDTISQGLKSIVVRCES